MRCPFCYNPSLVLSSSMKSTSEISEVDIINFLKKRRKYLDGIVITGGEPTLQGDLARFCRKLKKMDYLIKLDTNGLLPNNLQKLTDEKLIDYIAMDIKAPLEKYHKVAGVGENVENINESVKIIIKSGLPHEFRSTIVSGLHNRSDIKKMAGIVSGADKYFLQNFKKQKNLVGKGFDGRGFTQKTMKEFRDIVSNYVSRCEIR